VKKMTLILAAMLAFPALLSAQSIENKLGAAYAKAASHKKIALIAVARKDALVKYREAQHALDQVVLLEVKKGNNSEEKLKILGAIRQKAIHALKVINNERRKVKKSFVGFVEPDLSTQIAIAVSYVADAAGAKPALENLACLKLVRDSTSWTAHSNLTLAYVTNALARDKNYMAADYRGQLSIIKSICEDKRMLANLDRKYVEQAVLSKWISSEISAGKKPAALLAEVKNLAAKKQICSFTSVWAQGFITKLADIR
jgi:hypothetical protein